MRLIALATLASLLAASPAAAQDRTGIRDCDDFLVWFTACMQAAPIPPEARPIFQAALDQMRSGWQTIGNGSDGRAALARSCRDFGGAMRQQLSGFGCRP
jgi:hypothetical protein